MNIVDYLGGSEGVEVMIESTFAEMATSPDEGGIMGGSARARWAVLRFAIESESVGVEVPLTDIRIPNYYRDRNQRRMPIMIAYAQVLDQGWTELFTYKTSLNQVMIDCRHDPLLVKIAESTMSKLARGCKVHKINEAGDKYTYQLPEKKQSYTDGIVEPDASLSEKVKWYLEEEASGRVNLTGRGLDIIEFRERLRHWVQTTNSRVREVGDSDARRVLRGDERKLWFSAMRLLKPFIANTKPKHKELDLLSFPSDAGWWDLVKYFSNNHDTALNRAIDLANAASRLRPMVVQIREAKQRQDQEALQRELANRTTGDGSGIVRQGGTGEPADVQV